MTLYAGETVTITTSATQPDGTTITDADVTGAFITIYDKTSGSVVQAEASLTWDATNEQWSYAWSTTVAGSFDARLRLTGLTFDTWEFVAIKVKEDKY